MEPPKADKVEKRKFKVSKSNNANIILKVSEKPEDLVVYKKFKESLGIESEAEI